MNPLDRGTRYLWAAALGFLGLVPLVNWIPGGHQADWYSGVLNDWLSGSAIAIGGGVVLAIVTRRFGWWRPGLADRLLAGYQRHPAWWTIAISLVALVCYAIASVAVFDATPLLIDEIVQLYQARIFAEGAMVREVLHPQFFSAMHLVDLEGRLYAQFPAGGPAMLALGTLAGAEWLVNPVAGAVAVAAFGYFVNSLDDSPAVRLGATVLFAFAPFTLFMSASFMNHVTTLMWLTVALAFLAAITKRGHRPWLAAFGCGLALGMAATIRPVDGFAFALPAGLWLLIRTMRDRSRLPELLFSGLGLALPAAGLLWANAMQTGDPFTLGYQVLWGDIQSLGFHQAPWGEPHTPVRGLELLSLYFLRLSTYLFESPFPSLLPATIGLLLARKLEPLDRYLMLASALLTGLYFSYWFDGFYLGPRFVYPLVPFLVLWTARTPRLIKQRFGDRLPYRATVWSFVVALVLAVLVSVPFRARMYASGLVTPRWDADGAAAAAGISNSLVLVRESWGAQVLALLWARGVSRSEAEFLYRKVDTCRLYQAILQLEREGVTGDSAAARLRPLLADSARVQKSQLSPDPTQRFLPGTFYPPACRVRLAEDLAGFALYPPLILAGSNGNIYARDLHARDSLLLQQYPGRPVYLLDQNPLIRGATPRFSELSVDSLWRSWRNVPSGSAGSGS